MRISRRGMYQTVEIEDIKFYEIGAGLKVKKARMAGPERRRQEVKRDEFREIMNYAGYCRPVVLKVLSPDQEP